MRLDRQDADAQRRAQHEENTRLALWRLDSLLAPIVSQEAVRPYFHFTAYYPVVGGYSASLTPIHDGAVFAPSPLITFASPVIRLHFQIDGQGQPSSPQVPDGLLLAALRERLGPEMPRRELGPVLAAFPDLAERHSLRTLASAACGDDFQIVSTSADGAAGEGWSVVCSPLAIPKAPPASIEPSPETPDGDPSELAQAAAGRARIAPQQQQLRSVVEYSQRQKAVDIHSRISQTNNAYLARKRTQASPADGNERAHGTAPGPGADVLGSVLSWGLVEATPFDWIWLDEELFYVRRVRFGETEALQGCWFDWTAMKQFVDNEIRDLLPGAELRATPSDAPRPMTNAFAAVPYTLASIPAELLPGELPRGDDRLSLTTRNSLVIAWTCVLLGIAAVGAVLRGTVALGERRADFVSAVTHELRTPLTTFRLYLEMLFSGRVRDPQRRDEYLATLQSESERLGHLVENVLRYARLERGRCPNCHERWNVGSLVERFAEHLRRRSEQGAMSLRIDVQDSGAAAILLTDPAAVEQILYNLVDNACKYAACDGSREIRLEVAAAGGDCLFQVTDSGPGLTAEARAKLFRPFSKSAQRAADTASGVGLGLALSRRLARELGGDLLYAKSSRGARFVLRLPTE